MALQQSVRPVLAKMAAAPAALLLQAQQRQLHSGLGVVLQQLLLLQLERWLQLLPLQLLPLQLLPLQLLPLLLLPLQLLPLLLQGACRPIQAA